MLDAALMLAEAGCPVFPCRPYMKVPATSDGFKSATTDEEMIRKWWPPDVNPFNLAVPTGILFDVIDVDGLDGMNAIEMWAPDSPSIKRLQPTVLTPSGGYHIYLPPTGHGNRAGMLERVDYRGIGGYVLVPPSRTEKGEYRWV